MKDDLISRQAAIDAVNEYIARIGKLKRRGLTKGEKAISIDTVGTIKTLPSTQPEQPEIIHCKDCKYNPNPPECGNAACVLFYGMTDQMGFCHHGERRKRE